MSLANTTQRLFVAGSDGIEVRSFHITPEMDAAMDILGDANMLDVKRIQLLMACERDPGNAFGGNPEHLARKMVHLSRAFR